MRDGLVSIVLVNWNCGRFVDVIFGSIAHQTYRPLEVIAVDNGSTDASISQIQKTYPAARIVPLGSNRGFSHALNVGIRETQGEYVLSLNFDVALEPEFIASLVSALQGDRAAGWAAGALRRLTPTGVVDSIDCNGHYLLPSRYCYGYNPFYPDPASYTQAGYVFGASACAALYRRAMLESLSEGNEIFDEDLFAYFEDIDLDWRAQQRGYRCLFVPDAKGAHARGGINAQERPDVAALLMANRFLVMIKNDDLKDVLHDLSPIVRRTLVDMVMYGRRHPWAVVSAVYRVMKLAPRMLGKRGAIKSSRATEKSPVQTFRLPTRFLG